MQISLMAGLPCVVTRFASSELLPDNLVWKVEPGETEAAELREVLRCIRSKSFFEANDPVKSYAVETFDAGMVAGELSHVFTRSAARLARVMERWERLSNDARASLLEECRSVMAGTGSLFGAPIWDRLAAPVMSDLGWQH